MEDLTPAKAAERIGRILFPGVSQDQVIDKYDKWHAYDQDVKAALYNGPAYAAEGLARHIPAEDRASACVLDIAAGTGLVGLELLQRGFNNVDALDPSTGMLEKARRRGCYRKFVNDLLGGVKDPVSDDAYDAVVSSGAFGDGHLPCASLLQMTRITKPGGLVVFTFREKFMFELEEYKDRLHLLMIKLEKDGCWQKLERLVEPEYFNGLDGVTYVYRVITSGAPSETD